MGYKASLASVRSHLYHFYLRCGTLGGRKKNSVIFLTYRDRLGSNPSLLLLAGMWNILIEERTKYDFLCSDVESEQFFLCDLMYSTRLYYM